MFYTLITDMRRSIDSKVETDIYMYTLSTQAMYPLNFKLLSTKSSIFIFSSYLMTMSKYFSLLALTTARLPRGPKRVCKNMLGWN